MLTFQIICIQIGPRHSDGIPVRIFRKKLTLKKISRPTNNLKYFERGGDKELNAVKYSSAPFPSFIGSYMKESVKQETLVHFSLFREKRENFFSQFSRYVDFPCTNE